MSQIWTVFLHHMNSNMMTNLPIAMNIDRSNNTSQQARCNRSRMLTLEVAGSLDSQLPSNWCKNKENSLCSGPCISQGKEECTLFQAAFCSCRDPVHQVSDDACQNPMVVSYFSKFASLSVSCYVRQRRRFLHLLQRVNITPSCRVAVVDEWRRPV